ncbi:MAG: hypothetical protein A2X93_07915 [Deltaproteobacteria bacterium GWC2_56_8]|nr:MAG: hypothetical protein A2X93_07915 [Deltaproteobacteria bacterium GWC2_56_8]
MLEAAIVRFDGLCEPNPGGVACAGYVIDRPGRPSVTGYAVLSSGPDMTGNIAEYGALIMALEMARGLGVEILTVKGDSLLVVNQMRGRFAVNSLKLLPYYRKAVELAAVFNGVVFEWVPREENTEADALSRKAFEDLVGPEDVDDAERLERARLILDCGLVSPVSADIYRVKQYIVDLAGQICECKDHEYRKCRCKHIIAAELFRTEAAHFTIFRQADNLMDGGEN